MWVVEKSSQHHEHQDMNFEDTTAKLTFLAKGKLLYAVLVFVFSSPLIDDWQQLVQSLPLPCVLPKMASITAAGRMFSGDAQEKMPPTSLSVIFTVMHVVGLPSKTISIISPDPNTRYCVTSEPDFLARHMNGLIQEWIIPGPFQFHVWTGIQFE